MSFTQASSDGLDAWLTANLHTTAQAKSDESERDANTWLEIRLFISSTFVDTHAERDALVKRVIPGLNRKLAPRLIRIVPVDLR